MNALQLFRQGQDYISIASHLNTTEAEIERQIHRLRQEEIDEAVRKREERRAYHRAYLEENREAITAYRKEKNVKDRARLREIREAHS